MFQNFVHAGNKREVVPEDAVMEMVWRQVMWEQV